MPVIAIDGPAAAGKGTLSRRIAETYGFHHLDTGLTYRRCTKAPLSSVIPDLIRDPVRDVHRAEDSSDE